MDRVRVRNPQPISRVKTGDIKTINEPVGAEWPMIKSSGFGARIGYARNSYSDLRCILQTKTFEGQALAMSYSRTLNEDGVNRAVL